MEPHRKGDLTEAVVLAELMRRGVPVAVPFWDNERYDLVVEHAASKRLFKLQVKTGWWREGCVRFKAYSTHTNAGGNVRKSYEGDVDYFAVYCHENDQLYLVPEGDVGSKMFLRVEEPDVTVPSINWADDYAFDVRWPPE